MYSDSVNSYFVPNGAGVIAVENLAAAAAVHGEMVCIKRCQVKKVMFVMLTAALSSTTDPKVEFNHRPTVGSQTSEVKIGDLTVPSGTAIGKVMYKEVEPVTINVGESVAFEHVTQATDAGTATGTGLYGFEFLDCPEEDANSTHMIESA